MRFAQHRLMCVGPNAHQKAAAAAHGAGHVTVDHEAQAAHQLLFGHVRLAGQQFA
jgi:hypothetical protein